MAYNGTLVDAVRLFKIKYDRMTKEDFIKKYKVWFSYTHRETLTSEMDADLDTLIEALRQPVVSGSDRIAYIEEELGRCNWCNRDAKYKTINQGNLCNHCYNKLHKFQ